MGIKNTDGKSEVCLSGCSSELQKFAMFLPHLVVRVVTVSTRYNLIAVFWNYKVSCSYSTQCCSLASTT